MKILSVIIPTHNMSAYIEQAIESLLIESIDCLDILVINDGSTDDSSEKAKKIVAEYPDSIRVIDKENGNYGSCINTGLKEAKGKYVKILDADDRFDKKAFEEYINFLRHQDSDIILNNYCEVTDTEEILRNYTFNEIPKRKDIILDSEEKECFPAERIAMHAVAFKLELLKKIGYQQTEGISYTDDEWVFSPFAYAHTIYNSDIILYRYLVGREGQTVNPEIINRRIDHLYKVLKSSTDFMYTYYDTITSFGRWYLTKRLERGFRNLFINYTLGGDKYATFDAQKFLKEIHQKNPELFAAINGLVIYIARLIPVRIFSEYYNHGTNSIKIQLLKYWLKTSAGLHKIIAIK